MRKRVIILGSTGSIGTQTLEVIAGLNALHEDGRWPARYDVVGLAAGRNAALLVQQAERLGVGTVAIHGDEAIDAPARVLRGADAACELVERVGCDIVVAAIVGIAGLRSTLAAARLGRAIALANKESLVAAGELVTAACAASGATLLPIDSEHAGLWQCLCSRGLFSPPLGSSPAGLAGLTITASGGPFRSREWTGEKLHAATLAQALRHPTWSMGGKVTIDSATLMNKSLEIVEAHWLFGVPAEKLSTLVHPQSLVHAIAHFADGSSVAQLARPDMKTAIVHALCFPAPAPSLPTTRPLDHAAFKGMEFEEPDADRFPLVTLGHRALRAGGTAGAVMSAANEAAVEAFIARAQGPTPLPFGAIPELVMAAVEEVPARPLKALEDCLRADAQARASVRKRLG